MSKMTVDVVTSYADKLWKDLAGTDDSIPMKITSVSLGFSGVESGETGQQTIEGFFQSPSATKPSSRADKLKRKWVEGQDLDNLVSSHSFVCSRCKKRIGLSTDEAIGDEDVVAAVLVRKRVEHDDFHFAQDLSRSSESSVSGGFRPSDMPPPPLSRKRKKMDEGGITKFFKRQ